MTAYARDWPTLIAALLAGAIIIGLGAAGSTGPPSRAASADLHPDDL